MHINQFRECKGYCLSWDCVIIYFVISVKSNYCKHNNFWDDCKNKISF